MKTKIFCLALLTGLLLFTEPVFAGNDIAATALIDFPMGIEENNNYNASLAAQLINGTVLAPGETFSFNSVVGPRTADRGFVYGLDAANNLDLGSGICREATVLYQAAKRAGMEIAERHSHYPPIDYAAPGEDAAIWWGVCDLKFTNTLGYPVKISTAMDNNENGYHLWAVFLKQEEGSPVEITVGNKEYKPFMGKLIDNRTFVPIDDLASIYNLKYCVQNNNGSLNAVVNGKEITEANGDIWRVNQGIAVHVRKWVQMFGGTVKWSPGKVTLLTKG